MPYTEGVVTLAVESKGPSKADEASHTGTYTDGTWVMRPPGPEHNKKWRALPMNMRTQEYPGGLERERPSPFQGLERDDAPVVHSEGSRLRYGESSRPNEVPAQRVRSTGRGGREEHEAASGWLERFLDG